MPRKAAPGALANPASRTFTRRCRCGGGAGYRVRMPGPDGRVAEVGQTAKFGELITADAIEIMRLDSIGALAPPNSSQEDVERELKERIARYQAERSTLPVGA